MRDQAEAHPGRAPVLKVTGLGRAVRYLGHYRTLALGAYLALFFSIAAQLVVPQLVQRIIDAITNGVSAESISALPPAQQVQALRAVGWSVSQLNRYLTGAEGALITAGLLIVVFALARGLFAFAQGYLSERTCIRQRNSASLSSDAFSSKSPVAANPSCRPRSANPVV